MYSYFLLLFLLLDETEQQNNNKKTTIKIQSVRNFTLGHQKSPVIEFQGLSYHYLYGFYMAFVKGSLSHAEPLLSDAETPEKHLIQVILRSLSSSVFQASNKFATNLSENRVSDLISGTKIVIFGEF